MSLTIFLYDCIGDITNLKSHEITTDLPVQK